MMTHAAMPAGRHGPDPLHPGWRPEHPAAALPAAHPRQTGQVQPPGYRPAPTSYQRPPETPIPPPPTTHGNMPEPEDEAAAGEVRWWADLRRQVAFRSKRLNSGHMIEADQRLGVRDALGPHGVMLFFTSGAAAEPHGYRLHTAYRLFLASPESNDLPRLLADLAVVAATNIARASAFGRRWHPLGPDGSMVNGGEMSVPDHACYVGAGVTTLDSDEGRWEQVARTLREASASVRHRSAWDLKGQCYVLLTDGTALHIDRDPHARLGDDGIRSTRTLDADRPSYYHNPHADLTEQGDYATREVWRHLATLHDILTTHLCGRRAA
ncbi:hypothetical protein ACQPYA_10080 [Micromonospora sp. CA-263727]|uniref:hypothetical protein n=1 Tax=Micromonospora sp. CA-263727 TaxID=3239967 RepID=UPI003D939FA6